MKVELLFFQDEANGEYGIAHSNAIDQGFNAFWNGIGIFHDVFEHSHEDTHKYFKDQYAFNLGGEMCALAKAYYFYDSMGITNRAFNNYRLFQEVVIEDTFSTAHESIAYGYCNFGYTLECNVPYQKPVKDNYMESHIKDKWQGLKQVQPRRDEHTTKEELEDMRQYKKSCTLSKILRLHRYGYRWAERQYPNNRHNQETLYNFINYWNLFTKTNSAEDMYNYFKGITFNITKKKGCIKWTATLIAKGFGKNVRLNEDREFNLEDYYPGQDFEFYN